METEHKQSICAFIHYSTDNIIPYYVDLYLNELANYFDEIALITNEREITNKATLNSKVRIQFEQNEGYDFGLFYKFFKKIDVENYHTIACINDSNLLLKPLSNVFEWSQKQTCDFWGLIDSEEKPWFSEHKNNYHIQSHFLILKETAIKLLPAYFNQLDVTSIFAESDAKQLRRRVINDWEIGLSQYLLSKNMHAAAFINSKCFNEKHQLKAKNLTHKAYALLLENDYPVLKKKLLKATWRSKFRLSELWMKTLQTYTNPIWDVQKMIKNQVL